MHRLILANLLLVALLVQPAQSADDGCRLIAERGPTVWRAALQPDEVRLTFIGHATFLIESPKGVTIETDYNDYVRSGIVPTIATMNKAHSTHYSLRPDPAIRYVLKGWNPDGPGPARHDLTIEDVRVRNVSTNIRSFAGATDYDGNSIFVFEVAGLCIAHLGHLHHTLDADHLRELGRIDVLLVPVDGSYTLDVAGMIDVMKSISPALIIPMHIFTPYTLARFLDEAGKNWPIETSREPILILSRSTLPTTPKIVVLPGH